MGKVKVEIRLVKMVQGRWGGLVGETPDRTLFQLLSCIIALQCFVALASSAAPSSSEIPISHKRKNWEGITTDILVGDKEKTTEEDPNAGGDNSVNTFFQKIFTDADEDTRRAMVKSFQESGGTTLSTNWDEVKKGKVEVKPPAGGEWKKWG